MLERNKNEITFKEALRLAIDEEMEKDEKVFLIGEEVAEYGGAYKVSQGLWEKYGSRRVIDTPISEEGFTGLAIGAATLGLRPIVEWMTFNFSLVALDQVINHAAKILYMSGGKISVPIVFRGPNGGAENLSAQHSSSLEAYYIHCPGLTVVCPSTPNDAKGLLKSSIRHNGPVIFLESELLYSIKGEVEKTENLIPLGTADIKRKGETLSILCYGRTVLMALEAAIYFAEKGIELEVVDLRSLRPLDYITIERSIKKTNRGMILSESTPMASFATYLGWWVNHRCFDHLDAPVEVVCGEDVPIPYNSFLERNARISTEKIIQAIEQMKLAK